MQANPAARLDRGEKGYALTSNHKQTLVAKIGDRSAKVAVIGLGYVGLPLALRFAKSGFKVTGIDVDQAKVDRLRAGEDVFVCFSPEREDPGNPSFNSKSIPKICGGCTEACLEAGVALYWLGPGLGGHCIPIDPFYLTWKARQYGVHTRLIVDTRGVYLDPAPNVVKA